MHSLETSPTAPQLVPGAPRSARTRPAVRAVLVGGIAAGLLDALDAVIAFGLVLGLGPVKIYQFVASGMLGPRAYGGGVATALVGVAVHFLIAFSAAALFVALARRFAWLLEHPILSGTLYGVGVYAFMTRVVIPLSRIPPSAFSVALFVNGVVGHVLLVGIPIAFAARRYLHDRSRFQDSPGGARSAP